MVLTHVMTCLMFSLQHLLLSHLRLKRIRRINIVQQTHKHMTKWPMPANSCIRIWIPYIYSLAVGMSHKNLSWFSWEYFLCSDTYLLRSCDHHAVCVNVERSEAAHSSFLSTGVQHRYCHCGALSPYGKAACPPNCLWVNSGTCQSIPNRHERSG